MKLTAPPAAKVAREFVAKQDAELTVHASKQTRMKAKAEKRRDKAADLEEKKEQRALEEQVCHAFERCGVTACQHLVTTPGVNNRAAVTRAHVLQSRRCRRRSRTRWRRRTTPRPRSCTISSWRSG